MSEIPHASAMASVGCRAACFVASLCLLAVLTGCSWSTTAAAADTGAAPILGFADSEPALYLRLQAGTTVQLREIRYDELGRVSGFEEEIVVGALTTLVRVVWDPALSPSQPAESRYTAEVNGKPTTSPSLADWQRTEAAGTLAFSASDLGGIVLRSAGALQVELTTGFAYDDHGRRMLSEQKFVHEGVHYRIEYSGYRFDEFGRLAGYSAEVRQVE